MNDPQDFKLVCAKATQGDMTGLDAAAPHFRKVAASDASYLVYTGISFASIDF